jgi:quinoprotein glucose dehydrogenase
MKIQAAAIMLIPLATVIVLNSAVHAQPPTRSVWGGIYTEAQAARGKDLYSGQCAVCHGGELSGGEMAPSLAGVEFLSRWDGLSVGDLFERIRTTMPQNAPGSLGGQPAADILTFVLSVNGFPAGSTEMSKDAGVLKQIRIDAQKPAAPRP